MNNIPLLHLQEVFDPSRIYLIEKLRFLQGTGFYLAGGTALALLYGHRDSIDFDFFVSSDIDPEQLLWYLSKNLPDEIIELKSVSHNTLYVDINHVKCSFMTYDYPLVGEFVQTWYFPFASIEDIACMKLWTILHRATDKDYIDMYYILQDHERSDIMQDIAKKYSHITIQESLLLKSLAYFDDIVLHKPRLIDKNISRTKIQGRLQNFVRQQFLLVIKT